MTDPRQREAGGIDRGEDVRPLLPSLGKMLNTYDSKDIAHAAYVFDYIKAFQNDSRVKGFAADLAEEYASLFADWLGFVFMNRANSTRKSKQMKSLEEGLGDWVENIPAMLEKKAPREVANYVPSSSRFLNWKLVEAIGRKILKVVFQDWTGALSGGSKRADLDQLPIQYDRNWGSYVIPKSRMTFRYKRELKDLGFRWSNPRGVWFTDRLDSDILQALPQSGKLQKGAPPSIVGDPLDTEDWFFSTWLPANINRFSKVFNGYGRAEDVPYEFKFTVAGDDVEVDFRRNIKNLAQAIAELKSRYGKSADRDGWMLAVSAYAELKGAKGDAAIHAIDMANNLEHTHGAMMEHFPPGVRSWYPAFLDFKYTAHPRAMIKKIKSEDLRVVAEELLPLGDRRERLVTPKLDHRTPKGLALEISSQPGKANKKKMLKKVKEDYPDLYPDVVEMLNERGLKLASRRIASRWLRQYAR